MTFRLRPTDFYDYDAVTGSDGVERYLLRMNGGKLPIGMCTIVTDTEASWNGPRAVYRRITMWRSRHGRRYETFRDLDEAMRSGIDWAVRRLQQEDKR